MLFNYFNRYFSLVYNYCTSVQQSNDASVAALSNGMPGAGASSSRGRQRGGASSSAANSAMNVGGASTQFVGYELYRNIRELLSRRLHALLGTMLELHDETLLRAYNQHWEKFKFSANVLNGLTSYLNRHWVKREIDEGRTQVYEIYVVSKFIALLVFLLILFASFSYIHFTKTTFYHFPPIFIHFSPPLSPRRMIAYP